MRVLALVLVAAACGSDPVRHIPDGRPQPDARASDGAADTAPAPVTLTITKDGTPQAGVHVYFQNADSSLVLGTTTDATGTASAVMSPGGFATALNPFAAPSAGTPDLVKTFGGVKPGDHLVLRSTTAPASITVNLVAPVDSTTTAYYFSSSCGGGGLSIGSGATTVTGTASLAGCNGTADALIVTADAAGVPVSYIAKPGLAVADQATLDFSASAYTATVQRDYTINNNPNSTSIIDIFDTMATARGAAYQAFFGASGNPVTKSWKLPVIALAGDVVQLREFTPTSISTRNVVAWGPLSAFTVDFGGNLVPDLAAYPTYVAAQHAVTWTEVNGMATPDFVVSQVQATRTADNRSWTWAVAVPRAGTAVGFPTLPTDVYDYNIAMADSSQVAGLDLVKVPGGYDAVRAGVLATSAPTELVLGATGTLSFTSVAPLTRRQPTTTHTLRSRFAR